MEEPLIEVPHPCTSRKFHKIVNQSTVRLCGIVGDPNRIKKMKIEKEFDKKEWHRNLIPTMSFPNHSQLSDVVCNFLNCFNLAMKKSEKRSQWYLEDCIPIRMHINYWRLSVKFFALVSDFFQSFVVTGIKRCKTQVHRYICYLPALVTYQTTSLPV